MGFSLIFMRVKGNQELDADREGLAAFLAARKLTVAPSTDATHHLAGPDGELTFDGAWTDLHLKPLDHDGYVTGGVWHATLSDEECAFIYDLCVAGRMLIVNPQGDPQIVVPGRTHALADLAPDIPEDEIAWVDSAEELSEALSGNFEAFLAYRKRVLDS